MNSFNCFACFKKNLVTLTYSIKEINIKCKSPLQSTPFCLGLRGKSPPCPFSRYFLVRTQELLLHTLQYALKFSLATPDVKIFK